MKSIIIYYSYSGNTKSVAQVLWQHLIKSGEVVNLELKGVDESRNFFVQCIRAFRRKRGLIQKVETDLSAYDIICFGTPVWAFGTAPALNTYLDKCTGLEGKDIILFTTFGSGTGNTRCLDYIQDILTKKGAKSFKRFSIQQLKAHTPDFVAAKITEGLK